MFSVGRIRTSTGNTKLKGESKIFYVQHHISWPGPNESSHFQANLIWWDSPFKDQVPLKIYKRNISGSMQKKDLSIDITINPVNFCWTVPLKLRIFFCYEYPWSVKQS